MYTGIANESGFQCLEKYVLSSNFVPVSCMARKHYILIRLHHHLVNCQYYYKQKLNNVWHAKVHIYRETYKLVR